MLLLNVENRFHLLQLSNVHVTVFLLIAMVLLHDALLNVVEIARSALNLDCVHLEPLAMETRPQLNTVLQEDPVVVGAAGNC